MTDNSDGDYFVCFHCGADLPAGAHFCRHCGASEDHGWNEGDLEDDPAAGYGAEDDFDYDGFLEEEFPESADPDSSLRNKKRWVTFVILILCAALALAAVFSL